MEDDFQLPDNDSENKMEELESRIEELENSTAEGIGSIGTLFVLAGVYFFGAVLAMILSWSQHASILYCIWHGLWSWAYVAYFALTR